MNSAPFIELLCAGAAVVVGSFVTGVDAALTSLPEPRIRALLDELGPRGGENLARYLADPTALLTRLLTIRVTSLVGAAILTTNALVPTRAPGWELALVTLAIALAFGALAELSTTIARARGRSLASPALSLARPLELLIAPIAAPLVWLGRSIQSRSAMRASDPAPITDREMEYLVEEAENSGGLDEKRGQMLQNVLELKDLTARDVMIPRTRVHALDVSVGIEAALAQVTEEGHSRVPVFRGQIDNVVGVLHVKDLFRQVQTLGAAGASGGDMSLEALVRKPPYLVAASQSALTVLRDMQSRRTHMAMVVDEYGAVTGVVTLEDILERLVGDIQDEHDADEAQWVDEGNGRFLASAAMSIQDVGEQLGVDFPEDETYASLGGFVAERAGRVPPVGTVVTWNGYVFTVRDADMRRAIKVEIAREDETADPHAHAAGE